MIRPAGVPPKINSAPHSRITPEKLKNREILQAMTHSDTTLLQEESRAPRLPGLCYLAGPAVTFAVVGSYAAYDFYQRTNLMDSTVKVYEAIGAFVWAGMLGALMAVFSLLFVDILLNDCHKYFSRTR